VCLCVCVCVFVFVWEGGGGYLIKLYVLVCVCVSSLHSCVLIPEKKAFQQTFGVERNKNLMEIGTKQCSRTRKSARSNVLEKEFNGNRHEAMF